MLETIREFAHERLEASGQENALRTLQADWLLELADRAGTRAIVDDLLPWEFDLVTPELDNVRAVLDWAAEHDPERGLRLATWLEAFWVVRDPVEGASRLEQLLARAPDAEPQLRAHALRALGGALDISGDSERAAPCYERSLELFIATGDEIHAAHIRFRIAANMSIRGDTAAAFPLLEDVLRRSRRLGMKPAESQALAFLADKADADGDLELAIELALESAAIAHEAGWAWWEAGELLQRCDLRAKAQPARCGREPCDPCARAGSGARRPAAHAVRRGRAGRHRRSTRRRRAGRPSLGGNRERSGHETNRPVGASPRGARSPRPARAGAGVRSRTHRGQPALDRPGRRPRDNRSRLAGLRLGEAVVDPDGAGRRVDRDPGRVRALRQGDGRANAAREEDAVDDLAGGHPDAAAGERRLGRVSAETERRTGTACAGSICVIVAWTPSSSQRVRLFGASTATRCQGCCAKWKVFVLCVRGSTRSTAWSTHSQIQTYESAGMRICVSIAPLAKLSVTRFVAGSIRTSVAFPSSAHTAPSPTAIEPLPKSPGRRMLATRRPLSSSSRSTSATRAPASGPLRTTAFRATQTAPAPIAKPAASAGSRNVRRSAPLARSRTAIVRPSPPPRSQSVPSTTHRLAPQPQPIWLSRTVETTRPLDGSIRSRLAAAALELPPNAQTDAPAAAAATTATTAAATSGHLRRRRAFAEDLGQPLRRRPPARAAPAGAPRSRAGGRGATRRRRPSADGCRLPRIPRRSRRRGRASSASREPPRHRRSPSPGRRCGPRCPSACRRSPRTRRYGARRVRPGRSPGLRPRVLRRPAAPGRARRTWRRSCRPPCPARGHGSASAPAGRSGGTAPAPCANGRRPAPSRVRSSRRCR